MAGSALPRDGALITSSCLELVSGLPTAFDRVLATRFGLNAIESVKDHAWGTMVGLRGTDIVRVPLAQATGILETVPIERYREATAFFG